MDTDNPFEKVLGRLREKGWVQKRAGGEPGPNCIIGAAYFSDVPLIWTGRYPLLQIIRSEYDFSAVSVFNDHRDTTFADVERVLEKAAVKWEEERVWRDE